MHPIDGIAGSPPRRADDARDARVLEAAHLVPVRGPGADDELEAAFASALLFAQRLDARHEPGRALGRVVEAEPAVSDARGAATTSPETKFIANNDAALSTAELDP